MSQCVDQVTTFFWTPTVKSRWVDNIRGQVLFVEPGFSPNEAVFNKKYMLGFAASAILDIYVFMGNLYF